ncbi:MAG TPA: hypothetical protein VMZ71_08255 [Gemmataceae bacterium]|nr:hypothetical protein [Gemmataceae bacterium]
MSVQICSPLPGDTVTSPVTVVAAYSAASSFDMTCKVGSQAEPSPQNHGPGGGFHTTPAAHITVSTPGTYDVSASSNSSDPGMAITSGVIVTGGTPPVFAPSVEVPLIAGGKANKKFHIKGECNPALSVAYVICRVWQVDLTGGGGPVLSVIAAGADTVRKNGPKLEWRVDVNFDVDEDEKRVQYMAQISAYTAQDVLLGKTTIFIASKPA